MCGPDSVRVRPLIRAPPAHRRPRAASGPLPPRTAPAALTGLTQLPQCTPYTVLTVYTRCAALTPCTWFTQLTWPTRSESLRRASLWRTGRSRRRPPGGSPRGDPGASSPRPSRAETSGTGEVRRSHGRHAFRLAGACDAARTAGRAHNVTPRVTSAPRRRPGRPAASPAGLLALYWRGSNGWLTAQGRERSGRAGSAPGPPGRPGSDRPTAAGERSVMSIRSLRDATPLPRATSSPPRASRPHQLVRRRRSRTYRPRDAAARHGRARRGGRACTSGSGRP